MAAISTESGASARRSHFRLRWLVGAGLAIPTALVVAAWWFTAPIDDAKNDPIVATAPESAKSAEIAPPARLAWPDEKLEGEKAKQLLLSILSDVARQLDRVEGYTATFRKQERIGGKLQPEQTLAMKVRQKPFSVYFKFLAPKAGKEVVYAEGRHKNKVIAHNGDWTRRLIPRLELEPTGSVALAENRHPITEAGLINLVRKLVGFRKLDVEDAHAATVLDRTTATDGRTWLRSTHVHVQKSAARPFARVEVLYDPETFHPRQISSWDWPDSGHKGELPLAERYVYDDVKLDAPLTAIDFDPANPNYAFQRF